MKTILQFLSASLLIALLGCASANPNAGQPVVTTNPVTGVTTTNPAPAFLPNSTVTTIAGYGSQISPFVPAPWGAILTGALALATTIAGGIAVKKNNQANAATATASQLAASVVAQGPTVAQAVLDHASNNEAVYPSVAAAVNNKTV